MIELSSQITAKTKENILASAYEITMPSTGERISSAVTSIRQNIVDFSADTKSKIDKLDKDINTTVTNKINALSADTKSKIDKLDNDINVTITNKINALSADTNTKIGVLSSLTTTKKDNVVAAINELDDVLFPISVSFSVSQTNTSVTANTISYSLTRKSTSFVPDSAVIKKQVFSTGTPTVLATLKTATGSTNSNITGNAEGFSIAVTKTGLTSKSTTTVRYICYCGASTATTISETVVNTLKKAEYTSPSFNASVSTIKNQYIWIVVPNDIYISKVTSNGFEFSLQSTSAPQTVKTSLGTFKAYRSLNALDAADWTLVISGGSNFKFN